MCMASLVLAMLCPGLGMAAIPLISITADSVDLEDARLEQVAFSYLPDGDFHLQASRLNLQGGNYVLEDFSTNGRLSQLPVAGGELKIQADVFVAGHSARLEIESEGDAIHLRLSLEDHSLASLAGFEGLPEEAGWISGGTLDADFLYAHRQGKEPEISYRLQIDDMAFDSPQGRFAGESLYLQASGSIEGSEAIEATVSGAIQRGELLIDNFYRNFSDAGLEFAFQPAWREDSVQLENIRLADNSAVVFEGRAELPGGDRANDWTLEVNRLDLEFPAAYERYMEAAAAAWTLDGLGVTGSINWSGEWNQGEFRSGDLEVRDLTVVDIQQNRFAITGLDTRLRPGDHAFESSLGWRGLMFGRINLGAGEIALDSEPGVIAMVRPLMLEVMGGSLSLQELQVVLPGSSGDREGEPDISLRASLHELDMEQLTKALDWPAFSGKLSGEIPAVRLEDGVLEVDGRVLVNVFGGEISLQDVRVERLFGVLPSLAANIEVSNLDLELLTSTFSFGQISGRLDGYVHELRMLDWKPVAFDAWLGTPSTQEDKNNISRQAVNRLTTIGGGRATTALTSPLMRMFNRFSYRRLGLGCRLSNNACEVRGIGEDEVSVLLMEGAGIPKITIRAFNRQVDWPQMVANLLAISGEQSIRTGN